MLRKLTGVITLLISCAALTGCGPKPVHHHETSHPRTATIKKSHPKHVIHHRKTAKVNSKQIDKSGLSNNDIKKDSEAVHQKSSTQPVD